MKIISFSLWGDSPKYVAGAIRNADLSPIHYPGWICRFHCAASVPQDAVARLLSSPHVEVVPHQTAGWAALFWRFADVADPGADAIIVRDTDSRLNARERAAVDEWLASGADGHIMRDHPLHNRPMLGGMWGSRGGSLPDIASLIERAPASDRYQTDQDFLESAIWPRWRSSAVQHDEYYGGRPFPTARVGRAFVGQPVDEFDRPLIEGPTAFERRLRQAARRLAHVARLRPAPFRFSP